MEEYATLTNKDRYTIFSFKDYTITFMHGKDLIKYIEVTNIDDGVLTVLCMGKIKKEYEDYIDLNYILNNLRMNPKVYLDGLHDIKILDV